MGRGVQRRASTEIDFSARFPPFASIGGSGTRLSPCSHGGLAPPLRLREAPWHLPALGRLIKVLYTARFALQPINFTPPEKMQRRCRQNIDLRELEIAGANLVDG